MQKNDKIRKAVKIALCVLSAICIVCEIVFIVLHFTIGLDTWYLSLTVAVCCLFTLPLSILNLIDSKNKKKKQENEKEVNPNDK